MKKELGGFLRSTIFLYKSAFESNFQQIEVHERKAIRECIEIDFENSLIYVNGFKRDKDYILKENDVVTIRVFPDDLGTQIAVAVIAITSVVGWIGGNIYTSVKYGEDLIQHWTKNEVENVDSLPSLSGAKNQNAKDKPIPFIMGKHLIAPYVLGQYTEPFGEDGEEQYLHLLFMVGQKDIQISDVKFGSTLIASSGTAGTNDYLTVDSSIYPTDKYGTLVQLKKGSHETTLSPANVLFNQKVIEESLQIQLLATTVNGVVETLKCDRVSAKYPQKVEVEFTLEGLIGYTDKNKAINATVSFKIDWSFTGDEGTWNTFLPETSITKQKSKTMRLCYSKPFTYEELYNQDGTLKMVDRVVYLRIQRTNAESTNSNTRDKIYLSAIRTWSFDPDKSNSEDGLVPQRPVTEAVMEKTTRLAVRVKAGHFLDGQIDEVNLVAQSLGRTCTYDNVNDVYEWSNELSPTRNPASIALMVMQGNMWDNGQGTNYGYADNKIDLYSFGQFYTECAKKGYYRQGDLVTEKYTCDGVLTSPKKLGDVLSAILNCGRASLVLNGNKYGVLQDKSLSQGGVLNPVMILNSQNILSQTNQKEFRDLPDGYRVTFVNEKDNWQQAEMLVGYSQSEIEAYNRGEKSLKFENVDISYMTNPDQVYKFIKYCLAKLKLRPEVWSIKVTTEGNLIDIGSLVSIQNDTLLVGIGNGAEVTELIYDDEDNPTEITGIRTDGTFLVEDISNTYGVKITQTDGINEPNVRVCEVEFDEAGTYSDFTFVEPISLGSTVVPTVGDIVSFGLADKITTDAICTNKQSNGDGTFNLTFIPYDEYVYTFENTGVLPEFASKVTPPISSVKWSIENDPIVLQGEQGLTGGTDGYQEYQFAWNTSEQTPPPDSDVWQGDMPNPPVEGTWYDAPPTWISPQVQPTDAIIWCRTKFIEGSESNYALRYQGTWDALNNVPQLSDATGTAGHFYRVINSATRNLGSGAVAWVEGKQITHNGISWEQSGFDTEGLLGYTPANNNLVPNEASASNQLSDKNFVNSSIATNTANFLGTNTTATTETEFLTWANTLSNKTNNDYVFWQTTDTSGNTVYKRYKYNGSTWVFEYNLNNSSFTASQWATINSGLGSADKTKIDAIPTFPLSAANGGTGQTTLNASANALINSLSTGTSDPQDDDYYVSQFAGGTQATYHRRPVSALSRTIHRYYDYVLNAPYTYTNNVQRYYWIKIGNFNVSSSRCESFEIFVSSDYNYNYKALYRLEISTFVSTSYTSISVALVNLYQSTNNQVQLCVGIDSALNVYVQPKAIWNSRIAIKRVQTSNITTLNFTKLTDETFGSAGQSFTPLKLVTDTGTIRYRNDTGVIEEGKPVIKTDIIGNANTATKATQDESGNNIKASYASSLEVSGNNLVLKNKNNTSLSTITVPYAETAGTLPFVTCSTAAATTAKATGLTGQTLNAGYRLCVKFTYNNTATSPTLTVNGTNYNIYRYGTTTANGSSTYPTWRANEVVDFIFDGSAFQMISANAVSMNLSNSTLYIRF